MGHKFEPHVIACYIYNIDYRLCIYICDNIYIKDYIYIYICDNIYIYMTIYIIYYILYYIIYSLLH